MTFIQYVTQFSREKKDNVYQLHSNNIYQLYNTSVRNMYNKCCGFQSSSLHLCKVRVYIRWGLDSCLGGRLEQCILYGSAQDEAEPNLVCLLVARRIKTCIF